jgi:hypothetical protein
LSAKSYSESRRQIALKRGLADNLAKARKVRMANIEARKTAPVKPVKAKAPAGVAKSAAKVKVPAKAKAKK